MKFWSVYSIQLRIELIYSPIVGIPAEEDRGKIFTTNKHLESLLTLVLVNVWIDTLLNISFINSLLHSVNCLRLLGVIILILGLLHSKYFYEQILVDQPVHCTLHNPHFLTVLISFNSVQRNI